MDADSILLTKYIETAERFEKFSECFPSLDLEQVFEAYKYYLIDIQNLISMESSLEYKRPLEDIQTMLFWQYEQFQEAYSIYEISEGQSPNSNCLHNMGLHKVQIESDTKIKKPKLNNEEEKAANRRSVIQSTRRNNTGNGFRDIAGLENVKTILRNSVLLPMNFPSLFKGGRKPWTQILLFGPPGTGKSKIASALACEAKAEFYSISSADLLSSWVGESEKMIKEVFEYTRNKNEKCIVFIDEIDSICRKRSNREGDHTRSMKNQLLVELDHNLTSESKCLVLCATNCPWDIDSAFMRRFQRRIYIPMPDRSTRLTLIKSKCTGINTDMSEKDWDIILDKTEGYSGSDLVNVTNYALQEPLGEIENNTIWMITDDGNWKPAPPNSSGFSTVSLSNIPFDKICARNVCLEDFIKAITHTPKTILKSELDEYNKFITMQY